MNLKTSLSRITKLEAMIDSPAYKRKQEREREAQKRAAFVLTWQRQVCCIKIWQSIMGDPNEVLNTELKHCSAFVALCGGREVYLSVRTRFLDAIREHNLLHDADWNELESELWLQSFSEVTGVPITEARERHEAIPVMTIRGFD